MKRPLMRQNIAQLEALFETLRGDPGTLRQLEHELQNRHVPRAVTLLAEVQAAMSRVFECARQHGKPVGILAPVDADARRYLELGASFVAVGSDLGVFRQATQALRDKFV